MPFKQLKIRTDNAVSHNQETQEGNKARVKPCEQPCWSLKTSEGEKTAGVNGLKAEGVKWQVKMVIPVTWPQLILSRTEGEHVSPGARGRRGGRVLAGSEVVHTHSCHMHFSTM